MLVDRDKLTTNLYNIVSSVKDRVAALQAVAALLKSSGSYRWVGLYDVDRAAGIVTNVVWSG
jgi:putative methionine-R-sulfoxide reductase with GAF domain